MNLIKTMNMSSRMKINVYLSEHMRYSIKETVLQHGHIKDSPSNLSHDRFHTQDIRSCLRRNRMGGAYPDNAAASDSLADEDPRNTNR
ncbi:Uncharacterized protein HZ326_9094 [Fusarium oxysporum f. sp. albedinis]|nr:Uncharacterized protein HZ326_9094 [Fusarium oxysporum f. sp. albedinis]